MDHEFFTIDESEHQGWDWFAVQFEDQSSLMVYQLRNKNGKKTNFSSRTYLSKNGRKLLNADDYTLIPVEYWRSNETNVDYPIKWNIRIPKLGNRYLHESHIKKSGIGTSKVNQSELLGRSMHSYRQPRWSGICRACWVLTL